MNLDSKIHYILEYNPVIGWFHHNRGTAPLNTFNNFQISEKMGDPLFSVFEKLMKEKYEIKDTRDFPKHKNPSETVIKKEWDHFLKVIEAVDKRRAPFSEKA